MPRFLRLALGALVWIALARATLAAEQETVARPLPNAKRSKILAGLDQPTEFDFREKSLSDSIEYFEQKHGIEILLDSKGFVSSHADADTRITQALKNITLRSALRLLLTPLDLTYVVGDGYLLITSQTEALEKLNLKVYPVEDLVTLKSDFRAPSAKNDFRLQMGMGGMGMGGGMPMQSEQGDFTSLIDVLTTIAPESWDEVGGPASIAPNRNAQTISVSQTETAHEEIVLLLAALRRVRDEQVAAAKPLGSAAAPEAADQKARLEVRGYRLMRGPNAFNKSGFRPPVGVVGDTTPREQPGATKPAAPPQPPGSEGGIVGKAPANQATPANATTPADKGAGLMDEKLAAWVEEIVKIVPEMIEPTSWEPAGEGMIRAVGEAVVVRNTEEVQRRVTRLMVELLPDYIPSGVPWAVWGGAFPRDHAAVRLMPATTNNWPQEAEPRPRGEEARLRESLQEGYDLEFDEVPLIDALKGLAEQCHAQLYIDRKALVDASIDIDTPVSYSVKGLTCALALRLMLDGQKLPYLIREGVLLITTELAAEQMRTIKVYPVFDLVVRKPGVPTTVPGLDFTSLSDSITTNIAPTSWDNVGGHGTIQPFTNSGALVVSQTTAVHEEIVEYLAALRDVRAEQQRADANP